MISERHETNRRQRELSEAEEAASVATETVKEHNSLSIGDVNNNCAEAMAETTADGGK